MDASNVLLHDEIKKPIAKVEKEQDEKVKVQEEVQQHLADAKTNMNKAHTKISSLSCHDRVVINRLRIGPRRLTNCYLLKGENQPDCQACQSALTGTKWPLMC